MYDAAPRGASPARIAKLIGTAAVGYAAQRLSDDEATMRLTLYQDALADIDADVLGEAFALAVRESRFFPTIAELRGFAARVPRPRRCVIAGRLRALLRQPPAPVAIEDPVTPDQMRSLLLRLGSALAA